MADIPIDRFAVPGTLVRAPISISFRKEKKVFHSKISSNMVEHFTTWKEMSSLWYENVFNCPSWEKGEKCYFLSCNLWSINRKAFVKSFSKILVIFSSQLNFTLMKQGIITISWGVQLNWKTKNHTMVKLIIDLCCPVPQMFHLFSSYFSEIKWSWEFDKYLARVSWWTSTQQSVTKPKFELQPHLADLPTGRSRIWGKCCLMLMSYYKDIVANQTRLWAKS